MVEVCETEKILKNIDGFSRRDNCPYKGKTYEGNLIGLGCRLARVGQAFAEGGNKVEIKDSSRKTSGKTINLDILI